VAAALAGKVWARVLMGVVVIAALALASTAQGGLISTGAASYCSPMATQAFASWGDQSAYTLLPNGSFENGGASWALSGGAKVVAGNEPFFLNSRATGTRCSCPREARPTARRCASRSATGTCAS
jgi:hypothetical protein